MCRLAKCHEYMRCATLVQNDIARELGIDLDLPVRKTCTCRLAKGLHDGSLKIAKSIKQKRSLLFSGNQLRMAMYVWDSSNIAYETYDDEYVIIRDLNRAGIKNAIDMISNYDVEHEFI